MLKYDSFWSSRADTSFISKIPPLRYAEDRFGLFLPTVYLPEIMIIKWVNYVERLFSVNVRISTSFTFPN